MKRGISRHEEFKMGRAFLKKPRVKEGEPLIDFSFSAEALASHSISFMSSNRIAMSLENGDNNPRKRKEEPNRTAENPFKKLKK